jgi:hypothetical protein
VDLVSWFPCVVTFGVALPFDKVLKGFITSMTSMVEHAFYLVLLFSVDKVRRWSRKVWSVGRCFMIGR